MIPFYKPYFTGDELKNISTLSSMQKISGDGEFTKKCSLWINENIKTSKSLLVNSCTSALEMAAILTDIQIGDEVIMPSYTFVSTANSFVLRGAKPVFVDIDKTTLNINHELIEEKITSKTKAIIPVHYAGISCEMNEIRSIAKKYNLLIIEDAAQAILAKYDDEPLGSIGDFGCLSFHDTKNIISGEGGALLINNENFHERAEIIREKGTNRTKFIRGEIDKYSWVDIGSSFLTSEITAAFLYGQLQHAYEITENRSTIWTYYHKSFKKLEEQGLVKRPSIPTNCVHNSHIYYLLLPSNAIRNEFIEIMKKRGVNCTFHYLPLNESEFYKKFYPNDSKTNLPVSKLISETIVRFPIWVGIEKFQKNIIDNAIEVIYSLVC